jgi:alanine-glyoxylate transaminase/serine-glyoxylate transaminase/serine-pyruvate transaminase
MKDRKLLMIPGPIEFTPEVMRAMGMPTTSHVAPNFIEAFGQALERLREVFLCPSGQSTLATLATALVRFWSVTARL